MISSLRTATISHLWRRHGARLQLGAIAALACVALLKLGEEFIRLLYDTGPIGAIDLIWYYRAVTQWFAGGNVFGDLGSEYPPASYALLFPLVGWSNAVEIRWVWAFLYTIALGWLAIVAIRQTQAGNLREKLLVGLLPLAMIGTGVAIGNGQPTPILMPMLLSGLLVLQQKRRTRALDLAACVCLLFSLIKPSISAPFFWIVLFAPPRIWQALAIAGPYIALTFYAASFQHSDLLSLFASAFQNGVLTASGQGYANLHWLLTMFGAQEHFAVASLLALGALGAWIYRNRSQDPWVLIGVTGIVARIWTYHQQYDNLLILCPLLALVRLGKQSPNPRQRFAALVLAALTMAGMMLPARWLFTDPFLFWVSSSAHVLTWGADLVFLLAQPGRTARLPLTTRPQLVVEQNRTIRSGPAAQG